MKNSTILSQLAKPTIISFIGLLFFSVTAVGTVSSTYSNQKAAWDQHQKMRENTAFKGLTWRNVGPVVQGGRAVDVIRPIDQPHVIYVAYASGGVWKSDNNGITFTFQE